MRSLRLARPRFGPRLTRAAAMLASAVLMTGAAPLVIGGGYAAAAPVASHSHGTTVRGTVSGDHAWDPTHHRQYKAVPTVTVDQTTNLTDQVVHVTWKNFTPSQDEAGNFFSSGLTYYAVTVLECRGTNPRPPTLWKWPDFGPDCYNFTSDNDNATHGAGNQAYTLTGKNGQGEVYFHVETTVENDFLKCDQSHPCSIVVVPNWGGVQPPGSAPHSSSVNCKNHSGDVGLIFGDYALDTQLGGACSWSDRIVVPLHFAPTSQNCPARGYAFAAEGAPMLARTIDQWRAGWCTGQSALSFDFNSGTNEDLARQGFLGGSGALTSAVDMAVVNRAADPAAAKQRKFTYAPVANSAVTIAYHIDNQQTGKLITKLTLDARLVAKLLTQSYSLAFDCTQGGNVGRQGPTCDPAVKGNPNDIFDDPEFKKLNPEYPRSDFPAVSLLNRGQFLPLVVNGTTDMVYELTKWIWSDPAARAFLKGKPDPWGMHVNTYYKNEPMPADQFQVLDPGYTAPDSNGVPGQSTMQVSWNPITGLNNVAASLVVDRPSGIDPVLPPCGTNGVPCVYQRFGSEAPGKRALFAVVGLVDAAADRFPTARLINSAGNATTANDAGMRAALSHMTTDKNGITQAMNFAAKSAAQYPLTTVDYAMVPTCGLPAKKATAIQQFLHLVTRSQHIGLLPGQLAPGDLPLTGRQLAQTKRAAGAVSTTSCVTARRRHRSGPPPGNHAPQPGPAPAPAPGNNGPGAPAVPPATSAPAGSSRPTTSSGPATSPAPSTTPAAFGIKHSDSGLNTAVVLPLTLLLAALLFIGGPAAYVLVNTGRGARLVTRVRKGMHR